MHILIFGATGKVGQLVVPESLKRKHEVTAFVHATRSPWHDVSVIRGDIYDQPSVDAALAVRPDVIISTLGSWGSHRKDVVATGARAIVHAAEVHGVSRIVSLTGNLALAPGDNRAIGRTIMRGLGSVVMPKILYDGEEHINVLADSSLTWTVIRASIMTGQAAEAYTLTDTGASALISRRAVAMAMLDVAENGGWARRAPFIRQA